MRGLIRGCTLAAALVLAAPAWAQDKPEADAEAEDAEIVVEGIRAKERDKQITDFIGALTKAPVGGQISRFEEKACPTALGLAPAQNKIVADRMRTVAKAAGVPLGDEKCDPNVFVVVAQNKAAVLKDLRSKYADHLGDRGPVYNKSSPASTWFLEGLLDANGIPVGVKEDTGDGASGYYTVEMGSGSSRLRAPSRPHFLAAVLVVEAPAIAGLTTTQLADHAAMRLFARTDPNRVATTSAPTILTVLDAPEGSEVPVTMTQWDFGFLKALYTSGEGRYASAQRGEMKKILKKEMNKARAE
jgi:hypothetical protein